MNEQEPHYAGFWRRNAAYVIDYFVIAIFLLILLLSVVALGFWLGLHNHLGVIDQVDQLEIWINIILGLSLLLYFAGMESSAKQATLGKMAAGLVVTDLQAERITFLRAIGRNLAKILSALVLGIGRPAVLSTNPSIGDVTWVHIEIRLDFQPYRSDRAHLAHKVQVDEPSCPGPSGSCLGAANAG